MGMRKGGGGVEWTEGVNLLHGHFVYKLFNGLKKGSIQGGINISSITPIQNNKKQYYT